MHETMHALGFNYTSFRNLDRVYNHRKYNENELFYIDYDKSKGI